MFPLFALFACFPNMVIKNISQLHQMNHIEGLSLSQTHALGFDRIGVNLQSQTLLVIIKGDDCCILI